MSPFSQSSFQTDPNSNEYLLQNLASIQPRTSPSKFGGKIQFNIHFTPYVHQCLVDLVVLVLDAHVQRCVANLGDLYRESGQTSRGSFSAVSKPNFASKYSCESS